MADDTRDLTLHDADGREVFRLRADVAVLGLGTDGVPGVVVLRDDQGRDVLRLDGRVATAALGAIGSAGRFFARDAEGRVVFNADAGTASLLLGAMGAGGSLIIMDEQGRGTVALQGREGALIVGAPGRPGVIALRDTDAQTAISLDGASGRLNTGTIRARQAGYCERVSVTGAAGEGTVVVIGPDEHLVRCGQPYDRRVAGVLTKTAGVTVGTNGHHRLATSGRVLCRVDADQGAIEPGDLLTTSATPGHAMKADDADRAFGAVLGKAMRGMESGWGTIPVLVTLA